MQTVLYAKKSGPKLIVVTQYARVRVFIRKEMFVPAGSRCCPKYIVDNGFTVDALQQTQHTNPDTNINRTATVELLKQTRDFSLRNGNTILNFDNPKSMDNEDYYNLTGLTKDQFEELLSNLKDVDILLTKLRCGMGNYLLWHAEMTGDACGTDSKTCSNVELCSPSFGISPHY